MPFTNIPWDNGLYAAAGAVVMKVADFALGRKGREVKALGDAIKSVSEQLERTDRRLEHVEAKHEDCERNLAAVKAEIARMMSGPVATYEPKAPRHD